MKKSKRPRLRFFEDLPGQQHVHGADRYLYARPEAEFRLNVIGTGTIGQEHMRVAALIGIAPVHGIYDSSAHSLDVAAGNLERETGHAPVRHASLEDACNDPAADALVICTPNYTHLDVLRTAMRSGKPILLEKPMATTLADAAEIVRLARDYAAPVQVGLQYRYKAIYAEARHEVLERGSVGTVKSIALSEYRPLFLDKVGQWNKFSRLSGGTLIEKCCHYFDLMNLFAAAPPARVFAMGGQAVNFLEFEREGERADIHDHASVLIEYANGVQSNFALNMFAPRFCEELSICGDEGRLSASETFDIHRGGRCESRLAIERPEPHATRSVDVAYPDVVEHSGHHGGTWFEHEAFIAALRGDANGAAGVEQGFWSIVVGAAAERSVQTGAPVDVEAMLAEAGLADVAGDNVGHW